MTSDPRVHPPGSERRVSPVLSLPAGPECSTNFTAPRDVIKTPGFPEKYPNNLECTFMIFAPKMSEIVVEFDSFDMEPDPMPPPGAICRYDWLEIWDGFPAGEGGRRPLAPVSTFEMFLHRVCEGYKEFCTTHSALKTSEKGCRTNMKRRDKEKGSLRGRAKNRC